MVLSSPAGAGKTTISRALLKRHEEINLSISATTRPKRPAEEHGVDYYFVDPNEFEAMVKEGAFLEHAEVFGNRYGTPRKPVEEALLAGRDVLFDIDWQGTQQLRESARADLVSVFILPPSVGALEDRLRRRAQDPEDVVQSRMAKAADEMSHYAEYDYIVVNDDMDLALKQVEAILIAERLKRDRQVGLGEFVRQLREEV